MNDSVTRATMAAGVAAAVAVGVSMYWRHRKGVVPISSATADEHGDEKGRTPSRARRPSVERIAEAPSLRKTRRPSAEVVDEANDDDSILLHGRAKHDMTPSQLARRQHTDPLVSLMLDLIDKFTLPEACAIAEDLIADHLDATIHQAAPRTDLSALAPRLASTEFGRLWSPLHLREALIDYDAEAHVTCRQYVPATFRELRNICNLAQVRAAVAAPLQLLTFDGDKTLYPDRETLRTESPLVPLLLELMKVIAGL